MENINKFGFDARAGYRPHSTSRLVLMWLCVPILFISTLLVAEDQLPVVRVGALKFGTVNWELEVIRSQGLDRAYGFELQVVSLGSKNASNVALLGGAVDVIVSDWIWVSRLRAEGKPFVFAPYSLIVGKLYVHPNAGVTGLADLAGKKLGIAGGPVDKSWLLLRAYGQKTLGWDLDDKVIKSFVAPPLLNELMMRDEVSAALTFWHYGARLEAAGMKPIVDIEQVLTELGVDAPVPLLGWVFDENWAAQNPQAIQGLLAASYAAKAKLETDDAVWDSLRPMMKADDEATYQALKQGYRSGIPRQFAATERMAAAKAFDLLAQQGGAELIGKSQHLSPGTFWSGFELKP